MTSGHCLFSVDVLMLISSRMSNKSLDVLYESGLWSIMREFASNPYFWYMRVQNLTKVAIAWRVADWRTVYMNLRSAIDFHSGEVNVSGLRLLKSRFSDLDTIEVVLELNSIVPKEEYLHNACISGNVDVLQMLERRWNVVHTPNSIEMQSLVVDGYCDMLELLLQRVESMHTQGVDRLIRSAAEHDRPSVLELLLSFYEGTPAVMYCSLIDSIRCGYTEVVRVLLSSYKPFLGAGIAYAVRYEREEIISLLLENSSERATTTDLVIRYSIEVCNVGLARRYLSEMKEVEPGTREEKARIDHHSSAFVLACSRGYVEMAQLLLASGYANPTCRKNQALRLAVDRNRVAAVRWILTLECVDPLEGKKCALSIALERRGEILNLLLRDRRVWYTNLDLSRLPSATTYAWNRARSCVVALESISIATNEEEILSWIERPYNTYLSLLQFLLMKNPNREEVIDWYKGSNDKQVQRAMNECPSLSEVDTECDFVTVYRVVYVAALGVTLLSGTQIEKAAFSSLNRETLVYATLLLAALKR